MNFPRTDATRRHTESRVKNQEGGFSESYLNVQYIAHHLKTYPKSVTRQTTGSLLSLLYSNRFEKKKQSYFLYREAAQALIRMALDPTHPLARDTVLDLQKILLESKGRKHRAVSEALGSLPLKIPGPRIPEFNPGQIAHLSFKHLFEALGQPDVNQMTWHGRTLRFDAGEGQIGCIKFANSQENIPLLAREAGWLDFFREQSWFTGHTFEIPRPFSIRGKYLFEMSASPLPLPDIIAENKDIWSGCTAIVFFADPLYFHYPNDPDVCSGRDKEFIKDLFRRNAHLLGQMTARGLIHTALIPLFHNRVQQSRREDGGLYVWELGGRLDRWIESSRYPNFAASGLRDFEHIISIKTTRKIRHFIGEHILGFTLVLGSLFRNKAPGRIGTDGSGKPVDTRDLFDPELFSDILKAVVTSYYRCFTGSELEGVEYLFKGGMVEELIQSMGVDRHMEEALRIPDQQRMSDTDFRSFLISRGIALSRLEKTVKGQEDIVLMTGPHLGGFNQPISVPKLVDFLFTLSSLCVSDRYLMENGLKGCLN